jgi:hypothetical protein
LSFDVEIFEKKGRAIKPQVVPKRGLQKQHPSDRLNMSEVVTDPLHGDAGQNLGIRE